MKKRYDITGMSCSACSAAVERSVKKLDGAENVEVSLLTNSMTAEYDENKVSDSDIIKAVESAGYGASLHGEKSQSDEKVKKDDGLREMKIRLIVSFAFLIPLMYVAMGHMLSFPLPPFLNGVENGVSFSFIQFLLVLPIVFVNRKYYSAGYKSLFRGSPNMDTLIAVGSTAAIGYGVYAVFAIGYALGHGDMNSAMEYMHNLYFESGGMILTLITLGKYFEARSKRKTTDAISKLIELAPDTAVVERDGKEVEIMSKDVRVGDIVIIKAGKSVPVDGIIKEGSTAVDESAITGESIPTDKKAGDELTTGMVNKTGFVRLEATKVGEDTALSKIVKLVEEASSSKAPIATLADKVSGVFVPVVMIIAVVTFIVWSLISRDISFSLSLGISVLVISCPCALGLATPTAIMVGTGRGASNGILIRSAESLETLHKIDTVILDKTGTVTEGKPFVTDIIANNVSEKELLSLAATAEKRSQHPLAAAIIERTDKDKIEYNEPSEFEIIEGRGVRAFDGESVILAGNISLMTDNNINSDDFFSKGLLLAEKGITPLYFAKNGALLGIIGVADVIKETSEEAVDFFGKMDIDVVMLTGDNEKTAGYIAEKAGIKTVISDVHPDEKADVVKKYMDGGHTVAMIGDGINDAPALMSADVGLAIGAGIDIAIESADIVLMKSDLRDAAGAVKLSKAVIKNIKENLFWAFFYNVLGIPLAAGLLYIPLGIKLNPMIGAAAMSVSSVCVVLNALRLRNFKFTNKEKVRKTNMKKTVYIDGMMCSHCTGRVEKAFNEKDGITAEVSLENKCAVLELTKNYSDDELKKIVENAGYTVTDVK